MSFAPVRGQEGAVALLTRAVERDRVASSYLFVGPSGVGKRMAALALAEAVLGADAGVSRRIRDGAHPDVRVFEPRAEGRRNIQVETLREGILPVAQFAPFEASAAFLIFPDADVSFPTHPAEPANALLKTLEEPRPRVHFVLLSARPDRLLPTIRSRCQRVRFARLPDALLEEILRERGYPEEARAPAIALASGRADRAIAMAEEGAAAALLERALELDEVATSGGPGAIVRAAAAMAKAAEGVGTVLDALVTFYRDVAAAGLGAPDARLAFRHRAPTIRERAARLDPGRAAERVWLLQEAQLALEGNANPEITLDALLYDLRAT